MTLKLVIFDLDQTLVDSSALEILRNERQWGKVMRSIHLIKISSKIHELLNILSKNDLKIGIVTNSPGNYARAVLQYLQCPYDSLVAYHDVLKRKPSPDPFLKTLSNFNIDSKNVISFGDHDNDIKASKAANIFSIGVNWYSPEYIFEIKPDIIHKTFDESLNFINDMLC